MIALSSIGGLNHCINSPDSIDNVYTYAVYYVYTHKPGATCPTCKEIEMFKTILVPIDSSDTSLVAVDYAIDLSRTFNSE